MPACNFEGCAAKEALRLWTADMLGGKCFEVYWFHCHQAPVGWKRGRDKKSATTFFKPGK